MSISPIGREQAMNESQMTTTQAAQALFTSLLDEQVHLFTGVSTLSMDDVRQSLYLFCLEHAAGLDAFNPLLGTPKNYIMGRMWGLVERWRPMSSLDDILTDDHDPPIRQRLPDAMQAPGVETALIARAQRQAEERIRDDLELASRKSLHGLPTTVALVTHCDRPLSEVARRCGKNRWRLRKVVRQNRSGLEQDSRAAG